ncbi:MAG: hypothetical protein NTZ68_00490 [Candidatus Dependentiae bacterium]|nr:hypothetical protein [Candidatus Dependentiae bacterium]
MVKVQKNSMVLAAVVCLVGQAQAMDREIVKGLAVTSVAICAVESARSAVQTRTIGLGNLPFSIQREVRPTAVMPSNASVETLKFNKENGSQETKMIDVPTLAVTASKRFLGVNVGHVTVGVNFPENGSVLSKVLATEAHVEGINVEAVLKVGAAYLAYAQLAPKVAALLKK